MVARYDGDAVAVVGDGRRTGDEVLVGRRSRLGGLNVSTVVFERKARHRFGAWAVRTLVVHAKDDPLASPEASQRAADRIPAARFVSLESGGHLMLGQTEDHL